MRRRERMDHDETTMNTDDAAIASKLRDLVAPGGNAEIVTDLLDKDHAAVAEATMKFLLGLGAALRAAGVDPDAILVRSFSAVALLPFPVPDGELPRR